MKPICLFIYIKIIDLGWFDFYFIVLFSRVCKLKMIELRNYHKINTNIYF